MEVAFGPGVFSLPKGWRELERAVDRLTLRSDDGREQATISTIALARAPSADDFARICQHRLEAERRDMKDGFVNATGPKPGTTTFLYSGGDKTTRRIFSGYMTVSRGKLLTIYLEAVGIAPQQHLATFQHFVKGYRPSS